MRKIIILVIVLFFGCEYTEVSEIHSNAYNIQVIDENVFLIYEIEVLKNKNQSYSTKKIIDGIIYELYIKSKETNHIYIYKNDILKYYAECFWSYQVEKYKKDIKVEIKNTLKYKD